MNNKELASEVTLMPIEDLGVDAAIIFFRYFIYSTVFRNG